MEAMPSDNIIIKGAREHNLKNIDVVIPRDKLVAITGVSGSGKSSLAFDTIYAEGQRRYVESLSAYARQFLGRMEKPDVDYIEGLSPSISIDQKGPSHNPRSTVGTITEIYDYLRLLFARVGHPHCPNCGREISRQTIQQITDSIQAISKDSRILVLAPLVRGRKGEHQAIFDNLRKAGFVRVRVDGYIHDLSEELELDKNKKHSIEAVIDRLQIGEADNSRIADSVETALKLGAGVVIISIIDGEELLFSEHFACVNCGISIGEIAPRTFSFNSPYGACPACSGLGIKLEIDPSLLIPNKELTLAEGAIRAWGWSVWHASELQDLAQRCGFSINTPISKLSSEHLNLILYGEEGELVKYRNRYGRTREYYTGYEGAITYLERLYRETESSNTRAEIERYMASSPCPACHGKRLKPESLAVKIDGKNIIDVTELPTLETSCWTQSLSGGQNDKPLLTPHELKIAHQIIKEIGTRLSFLKDIGLGYLSLDRPSATLSGGEAQRIRLATQIGSGLMGVLYVCDEPTIGLHPADIFRLIETVKRLRDLGNTIIIVEHDEAIMRAADYIVDIGPGAGEHGGQIVATGRLREIMNCPKSITGQYLSRIKQIPLPQERRSGSGRELVIKGARENNLKNIDVPIPLGKFVCISGVSGSGKSTLINDVLYKKLAQAFYQAKDRPGKCDSITGIQHIDKVINIDQSPIGRTPRSNPTTYTGTFTPIRELFATVPEARMRGYQPGRFSFNVKGGRCESCQGEGYIQIEMQFLPDVTVPCEVCKGKRYNREALEIQFKGKNIADVLDMTVREGFTFFRGQPKVQARLKKLIDVGLDYVRLGQPANTLSGGESQRLKLAGYKSAARRGRSLFILDEPTTGLHFSDVVQLLDCFDALLAVGHSLIVVEHNLQLIKSADYVIDLGPGAADEGGQVVVQGTPEMVAKSPNSITGRFLAEILRADKRNSNSGH
jgi:excinuclease ABC subunit A